MKSVAELACIALGDDGQNFEFFGVLDEDHWRDVDGGALYLFSDGSAILDCGGAWDVAVQCAECELWSWPAANVTCPDCRSPLT